MPSRGHRRTVVPPQPLRQGPARLHPREEWTGGIVHQELLDAAGDGERPRVDGVLHVPLEDPLGDGAAGNTLRAGLWFEDSTRILARDWHRILDPTLNMTFDETPYWQQYDFAEWVTARDVDPGLAVDPDSDLLLSGGVTLETPVDGLELFAGYAENFKSLADRLLEVPGRSLAALEPGTATNGMRYSGDRVALGATWYDIDFDNRIFFLGPTTTAGPNYLISGGGAYFNAGGIDTSGVELSARVQMPGRTSFYTACTFNDSQYVDTGEALVDASQNIEPGTDVTGVPDRLWVLSLDRPGPLGMSISDKYTSSRRVSLTADWYADAYWLVDAYLTFSVDGLADRFKSTEVSLVANNLFDASYLAAIVENAAWLAAPPTRDSQDRSRSTPHRALRPIALPSAPETRARA